MSEKYSSIAILVKRFLKLVWWSLTFQLPSKLREWQKVREKRIKETNLLQDSNLFNNNWYLTQYPDVAEAKINPLTHYLTFGARERRNPNPLFDSDWYLTQYPDVAEASINPLTHYLTFGAQKGYDPNPLFDSDWYLTQYPDVAEASINPLAHYLTFGAQKGYDPNPLFDSDWYLAQYPDVAEASINPLTHYLTFGAQESLNPNPLFDSDWYLTQYPDVAEAKINPLTHYINFGVKKGYNPNPLFDSDWYLTQYPNVAEARINPLAHYLNFGIQVGYKPNPLQNCKTESSETWVPPGHFYSPIVDPGTLKKRQHIVFARDIQPDCINLQPEKQLEKIQKFEKHYLKLPFTAHKSPGLRYYYDNPAFSYGDAIILACLLMELRPKRLVEFGCGFSSCLTLDINELFLNNSLNCLFIDPYPDLLYSLLRDSNQWDKIHIIQSLAQDIDLQVIDNLEKGDFLFIDSTHVSKSGSDVNFHIFNILPRLKSGVYIHFHDIFYPFEYPEDWFFKENRSWNELYLLRAFLMYNPNYEIIVFNDFMIRKYPSEIEKIMPLFTKNSGGSLWLKKV